MTELKPAQEDRRPPEGPVAYGEAVRLLAAWLRSANTPERVSAATHFAARLWGQRPADVLRDALAYARQGQAR